MEKDREVEGQIELYRALHSSVRVSGGEDGGGAWMLPLLKDSSLRVQALPRPSQVAPRLIQDIMIPSSTLPAHH